MNTPLLDRVNIQEIRQTVPARDWLKILESRLQAIPRAAGAIFTWCPTSASRDLTPRVLVAQFGDGYAQRRPDGINTQEEMWNLQFDNRTAAQAAAIDAFLKARNGVDVFVWTPPRNTTALNVICPEWSIAWGDMLNGGDRVLNVTAKFQQVYA